ncbi:N-acetylmuramoyl-L-alanine amidase family protein [Clostridium saccharoperbutylacetonicum]|uniref:N-acetylmuramoyl-L-alanine amidase family protein n=1 Tax=Clostridium saccharoperbutylacetonicum TaxID=36745 RepID=UPI0039E7A1D3
MIKRITKITSLLICAASIISIIPAAAADIKSYDSQEGTIYTGKSAGQGFYIDGEIDGKDEAQYYLTADGKYTEISGLDSGSSVDDVLLNQYIEMDDGDTVVDLKDNYKVSDKNTRADLQDDVATTLRKKLKNDNDDRLDKDYVDVLQAGAKFLNGANGTGLSMYKYKLASSKISDLAAVGSSKTLDAFYVDYAGNYVDADYNIGSLRVNATTGASVTIKNTNDTYDVTDTKTGITYEYRAVIEEDNTNKYLCNSGDSIYRFVKLTIYGRTKTGIGAWGTWGNVTNSVSFGGKEYTVSGSNVVVLQKLSKTADTNNIEGVKYSKDSTLYFIADKDKNDEKMLARGSVEGFTKLGLSSPDTFVVAKTVGSIDKVLNTAFLVKHSDNTYTLYAENLKFKSEQGFNYIDIGDFDSVDTAQGSILSPQGSIYVLSDGYIKTWDGDKSFTKVYKVDGGLNNAQIVSKDLMLLWNQDDGIYTVINNKKDTSGATTGAVTTTSAAVGWVKAGDGTWSYNKAGGVKATGWVKDGNIWYYLNASGVMQTGWIKDNGTWYYLNKSGAMLTGWINDNETWYYCNEFGAMLANTTVDGYVLGASGAWIK